MNSDEWEKFVAKAARVGIVLDMPEPTEERVLEMREIARRNPPVDYLSLMK
jgi:hypothetical protein